MGNAIYIFGCACGADGRPITAVKQKINAVVFNIKRDSERYQEYINYMAGAGLEIKGFPPLVVENGGERVMLLNQWTSPL